MYYAEGNLVPQNQFGEYIEAKIQNLLSKNITNNPRGEN